MIIKNLTSGSVYFLFDGDRIVYVGQSVNFMSRSGSHKRDKTFTLCRVMFCLKRRMSYWESIFIKRYKPRYNKAGLKRSSLQRKLINAKPSSRTSGRVKFSHPPKASSGLRFEEGWAIGYEPQVEPYIHLSRTNLQKIIYGKVKYE